MNEYIKSEKSMIGKEFGKLIILSMDKNINGKIYYNCRCKNCGDIVSIRIDSIKKYGATSKCKCNGPIMSGNTYGNLKVLEYTKTKNNIKYFNCQCIKCNKVVEIRSDYIRRGYTYKCDCNLEPERVEIIDKNCGKIYGNLKIEKYIGKDKNNHALYKCICLKCNKNHPVVAFYNLASGNSTQCRECADKEVGLKNLNDLTGQTIGDYIILERFIDTENKYGKGTRYICQCKNCGSKFNLPYSSLSNKAYKHQCTICNNHSVTHGMSKTKFYAVWRGIIQRCTNINNPNYHHYGERGIKVCDRWMDFNNFMQDMYPSYLEYKETHPDEYISIDRIDNEGDYNPENCRWANRTTQLNNTRYNVRYNIGGDQYTIREIIDNGISDCDVSYNTIKTRLNRNAKIEDAILSPNRKNAINPLTFKDKDGNIIPDKYNKRNPY